MWISPLDGSIRMIHQYSIPGMSFGFLSAPMLNIRNKQAIFIYIAISPDKNHIERNLGQNNNVKKEETGIR